MLWVVLHWGLLPFPHPNQEFFSCEVDDSVRGHLDVGDVGSAGSF